MRDKNSHGLNTCSVHVLPAWSDSDRFDRRMAAFCAEDEMTGEDDEVMSLVRFASSYHKL